MALTLPASAQVIENQSKTDVQRSVPDSNPFERNSIIGAMVTAQSNRIFDNYLQLRQLELLLFPDTAQDQFLRRWASIFGVNQLPATKSSGNIIVSGTSGSIPINTKYVNSSGLLYTVTNTIALTVISGKAIATITRVGTTATVTFSTAAILGNNVQVTIAGADQSQYNGTKIITVIDADGNFTFEVSGSPATPATGTITASYVSASVPIESDDFQDSENNILVNMDAGEIISLQSPIVGVDTNAGVSFNGVVGGTDQESNIDLRSRFLFRVQNPVAHFNVTDIQDKAKEVPGVTRVFVQEITPSIGQVTIYFMRDNDSNPIPDAGEVTTTKNKILEIKPANTADVDVIVLAPTPLTVNFIFTALNPNTASMQTAINNNLLQFFAEETEVGVNIDEDSYRAAIKNTVDTETGENVIDFTLSTPVGDITIASNEIGVLGTVTYP